MELYTFENSAPGRLRADIHRYPVAFNNQIIDTFKRPVSTIGAKTLEGVVGALEKRKGKQIREILETTSLRVGDVVKIGIDPNSTDGRYTDIYLGITNDVHGARANVFFGNGEPKIHTSSSHRYNKSNGEGVAIQHIPSLALPDELCLPIKSRKTISGKGPELIRGLDSKTSGIYIEPRHIENIAVFKQGMSERLQNWLVENWNSFLEARRAEVRVKSKARGGR